MATSWFSAIAANTPPLMRTSAVLPPACGAAQRSRRTTLSALSARPDGPLARTCITSSASPDRRAIRSRSRCRPGCHCRRRIWRRSSITRARSSRGSTCSPTAISPSWSRKTLDGERRPATAGALRVGVLDDELGAFQPFLVIDLRANQVLVAHRVDEQQDAVLFHHGVVLVLHLVEGKAVLEARAAAAGDEHAQLELGIAFLVDQLPDLVRSAVAEHQRRRHLGDCVHFITPGSVSAHPPEASFSSTPLTSATWCTNLPSTTAPWWISILL